MFRVACSLTALVSLILFVILLIVPGHYTAGYGVAADTGGMFLGRRASPMLLGIAILLWMLRDQIDLGVQRAVAFAMIFSFAGIAATGIFAYATDTASPIILIAAAGELVIATVFVAVLRRA